MWSLSPPFLGVFDSLHPITKFKEQILDRSLEVILAVLLVSPRTGFLGAILLTGYLGGAVITHVRIGDAFIMPIVMGIVMCVGLALRQPAIWSLAVGADPTAKS